MALTEAEELEMLELENEEAQGMKDAPADFQPSGNAPPPNESYEVTGRYSTPGGAPSYAPPGTTGESTFSAKRALLTNEPTQGIGEDFVRGIPASLGGLVGGVAGAGVGTIPLAALGGVAGESARQGIAQAYAGATGRPFTPPGQVLRSVATQGVAQAAGQSIPVAGSAAIRAYGNRLPATLQSFFQIPEQMTKYTQGRAGQVLAPGNLVEGAALDSVGDATAGLAARRSSVGAQIGAAEDAVLAKIGDKAPALRHIREGLDKALYARGITDPKTAGLARGKEVGILSRLKEVLTPTEINIPDPTGLGVTSKTATEKLTLRQALNAKRLIDENLEFADKELSSSTEQLLKRVNHQIRESVRSDMGPEVSKLWDDFGKIADAQDKLAEFTGTRALSNVEQRAVQSLRGIMTKNPGEVDNIVKVLGEGLPGGEQQARQIFDSIAGAAFTKDAVGAPSSILLKAATAGGLLSAPVARGAVRFGEYMAKPGIIHPAVYRVGTAATAGAAGSGLSDYYGRLNRQIPQPDPAYQAIGGMRPAP